MMVQMKQPLRNERSQIPFPRLQLALLGLFWTSSFLMFPTTSAFSPRPFSRRLALHQGTARLGPSFHSIRPLYESQQQQEKDDTSSSTTRAVTKEREPNNLSMHFRFIHKILAECGYRPKNLSSELKLSTFHWLLNLVHQSRTLASERKAKLANSILTHIMDHPQNWTPNVQTLNLVLSAYHVKHQHQNTGHNESYPEAIHIFRSWQDWYRQGLVQEDVNLISYNKLMIILSRSAALIETERLFEEIQQRSNSDPSFAPDIVTIGGRLFAQAITGHTTEVTRWLEDMLSNGPSPSLLTLNDVLHAYSISKHPHHAIEFLEWWDTCDTAAVAPDSRSYNVVLRSIARSAVGREKYSNARHFFDAIPIQKDSVTYTTMIGICSRNLSGPYALQAMEELLKEAQADPGIVIDDPFVTNILYSLAATNEVEAPLLADQLVNDHCNGRPNLFVYEALAHCWSKSNDLNASRRALEILDTVESSKSVKPTVKLYTNVIGALKNQPGQEAVETVGKLLTKMETNGPPPNVATYSAAIGTIARSQLTDGAAIAFSFLQRMKVPPNIIVYNSILNACEYSPIATSGSVETLKIACDVFMRARNDANVQPSHITYGTFIATVGRLMEPSGQRDNMVLQVFKQCCREGQVSTYVVQKMKAAIISKALLHSAFEDHGETNLPNSWTRNVRNVPARFQQ